MGDDQYSPETLARMQATLLEILTEFTRICDKHHIPYMGLYGTVIGAVRHQGFIPWDDDIDVGMLREDYERFLQVIDEECGDRFGIKAPDAPDHYYTLIPKFYKKGTRFASANDHGKYNIGINIDIFVFDTLPDDPALQAKQVKRSLLLRAILLGKNVNFFTTTKNKKGQMPKYIGFAILHYLLQILPPSSDGIMKRWYKNAIKYNGTPAKRVAQFNSTHAVECSMDRADFDDLIELPFENIKLKVSANYDTHLRAFYGDYMQIPPEDKRKNHYPFILDFGD